MNPYVSLLVMGAVALLIAIGGLAMSAIISPNRRNSTKVRNYECGVDPTPANNAHGRFPVKFYLVGMTSSFSTLRSCSSTPGPALSQS